jgi:hypothetical protein
MLAYEKRYLLMTKDIISGKNVSKILPTPGEEGRGWLNSVPR